MAVAQDAAQDAMRTHSRPYSSFPLVEHQVSPVMGLDEGVAEKDGLKTVIDIQADASSDADFTFDKR